VSVTTAVSRETFAEAMTRLAAGVTVVTARQPGGQACGLLVTSICSYSAEPPSVLIAIGDTRGSCPALVACAEFGVHMLGRGHQPVASVFASGGADKFAAVAWRWDGEVPRLHRVPVFLRCARRAVFHHADHTIIIGEVVDVAIEAGEPMVYYRRRLTWRLG
jgi:flavin reductase ActVB